MQIKKLFQHSFFISRECKLFALLIIAAVCLAYILFAFIAYKNHKTTLRQKYKDQAIYLANSYESFLDNIFRQAEFVGHKVSENEKDLETINSLLQSRFSVDVNLDTTLLGSWIMFKWVDAKDKLRVAAKQGILPPETISEKYDIEIGRKKPWMLHFGEIHSKGHKLNNGFIPIIFGITNKYNQYSGSLVGEINLTSLLKYLQINRQKYDIIILDEHNNIIAQSNTHSTLPSDFFLKTNFKSSLDNFYKKSDLDNTLFLSYKKLESYPFTIVVGDQQQAIWKPLFKTLINYFLILFVVLISLLAILLFFYKQIIEPIVSLSHYAKDILDGKTSQYKPHTHTFTEINNLEEALKKINDYKGNLELANTQLSEKTNKLSEVRKQMENDLSRLSKSYNLRDNLLMESFKNKDWIAVEDCINYCLEMLFPEIYSRQLKINTDFIKTQEINVKCSIFAKIFSTILSRSFIFSHKNNQIDIKISKKTLDNEDYIIVSVEDDGMGNEEWRTQSLKDDSEFKEAKELALQLNGMIQCVNKDDTGVKYCILLPCNSSEAKKIDPEKSNKIIPLFPQK